MDNLSFLKEILTTRHEYWIVARKQEYNEYGRMKRGKDSIWFIVIPHDVRRELKPDEILLSEVEDLRNRQLQNIAISEPFPPFQHGISLYSVHSGYPITGNIKEALKKILNADCGDLWDYKELLNKDQEVQASVATIA